MDVYDKNFGDLEDNHKEEIIRIYRGYANYYSDITKYSTNLLTNWLFALNTGSIIGVISFLNNKETNVPDIYWATFIWIIGIDLSPKNKTMTLMRFPLKWHHWRPQDEKTIYRRTNYKSHQIP